MTIIFNACELTPPNTKQYEFEPRYIVIGEITGDVHGVFNCLGVAKDFCGGSPCLKVLRVTK